jgi:hypothetical protein
MKNIAKLALLTASLLFVSGSTYAAPSIGVRFTGDDPGGVGAWLLAPTDAAGVIEQTNWNQINTLGGGDSVAIDRGISGILQDSAGNYTAVQLQFFGNDAWRIDGPSDTPNDKLMKGTLRQNNTTSAPMTLTFTNLGTGSYDVYVYGNDVNGPADLDVSIGTVTNYWTEPRYFDGFFYEAASTDPSNRAAGNYVKFTGVSPASGTITVSAFYRAGNGGDGVGITGLQLVSSGGFTPFPSPTVMEASTQVQSVTVYNGSEASFSFASTNNAIPAITTSYQWYKNDQTLTNATGNYFTFLANTSDNGAKVYCKATLPPGLNLNNLSVTSATGTVTVLPCLIYTNGLKVEFFSGATRQEVEAGNVGPATSISLASSFEMPNDDILNYTRRVSGYFIPPTSGGYVFFVSADDDSDLLLSTDSDPAHKRLIAQEGNWDGSRQWVSVAGGSTSTLSQKRSDQWSPDGGVTTPYASGISLIAGHLYYLEGVQHQGAGGDYFGVTYKLIADADPLDGDAPMLQATNHNIALMTSPATNLVWVTQPVNVTNVVGKTVTLTSGGTSDSELQLLYQWYRNNSPVPGATGPNQSFAASLADNNTQWYVTASTAGGLSITSAVVTLTVKPPAFPQGLITFSDQDEALSDSLDPGMQPNPYTDVQGLPTGVTATFNVFASYAGVADHTQDGTSWSLYGSGDNDPEGSPASQKSIIFNMPVEVPSLWVYRSQYSAPAPTLKGYLNGVEQFTYSINASSGTWVEVTAGAGKLIDSILFDDYNDSHIDDVLIVKPTALITFSNQVGNDGPANPNPYTDAQGLWRGVTVTFDQFSNWKGSQDHTDTTDNYLLYGANYDAGGIASMTFNTSVEVPSLWVSTEGGGQSGKATLKGYLKNAEQFTYTITGGWVEVTAGAGKPIDSIRFIDYGDSWIDDITVNAITNALVPPAPARLSLVKNAGGTLTLSWTGQGRLEESLLLTSGWTTSANQANPQNVSATVSGKFYRVVNP